MLGSWPTGAPATRPEANGVVERFFQTIKYEELYRHELPDGPALHRRVVEAVDVYNRIRPHETLGQVSPLSIYLADPNLREGQSVSES